MVVVVVGVGQGEDRRKKKIGKVKRGGEGGKEVRKLNTNEQTSMYVYKLRSINSNP